MHCLQGVNILPVIVAFRHLFVRGYPCPFVRRVQASESMLGFLLERLGKLPVGHAKFAGKGVEYRVWNLDLGGVRVARENFDLVMKGFRLPKR